MSNETPHFYSIRNTCFLFNHLCPNKKGYFIGKTITIESTDFAFHFMPFQKLDVDSTMVGYIVKAESKNFGNTNYYALPFGSEILLNRSFNIIGTIDAEMLSSFFKAYVKLQTHLY